LVLPFWYWLTWLVPDKGPLNLYVFSFLVVLILVFLIECRVLIFCSMQVIQARQIYDEQLPFISKVLSAAIVGESNLI